MRGRGEATLRGLYTAMQSGVGSLRRTRTSWWLKRKAEANLSALRSALPEDAFSFDLSSARAFLSSRFAGYQDVRWHLMYGAATSRHAGDYVPEDLFYIWIEPELNPPDRLAPWREKNLAELLGVVPAPVTYARVVRGRLVGVDRRPLPWSALEAVLADAPDVVLKPARHTRQGRGLQRGAGAETFDRLRALGFDQGAEDWVIQAAIDQHPAIARLNPSSLNTFRVLTIRLDGAIHVLSTVLKIGRAGAVLDNLSAGGLAVAVAGDGALAATAHSVVGVPAIRHPDHGYLFGSERVPATDAIHDACRAAHDALPELDLVSWDAAMSADSTAVLVEANVFEQGVSIHQLCTGPLFGELTDRILRPRRVRMFGPWLR